MSFKSAPWKTLVVGHRWLGIATCLLFALWFASGLVMMYVGFPAYTQAERLQRLDPIDWSQVQVTPERVLHELALGEYPQDFRLEMMAGQPVYRVTARGTRPHTVSAIHGQTIGSVDASQAAAIVERATGSKVGQVTTLERDQWTVAGSFQAHRPLHRVTLSDRAGSHLYVSSRTGEIVLDTTARERGWNWVGAVLHWLYFTDLRAHPALWSQVVMWTSGVGIVVAITGLWLGIDRLRWRRREGKLSITPFRGWMAWHHIAGIVGGIFLLTWIFSGWLSMGPPVPWASDFDPDKRRAAMAALSGNTEPEFPMALEALQRLDVSDVREASFAWAFGQPQIEMKGGGSGGVQVIHARTRAARRFDDATILARADALMSGAHLADAQKLTAEDAYWYSRRAPRPLPVWRFKFSDADETWIHVDPATARLVGWVRTSDRIDRWLFNGLHSLDFRWLLKQRPAWDVALWILSLAGLTVCVTSIVISWRALMR